MAAESLRTALFNVTHHKRFSNPYPKKSPAADFSSRAFRASLEPNSDDKKHKLYKELGMLSLRKRIEDSILRAEMFAPEALEHEEAEHVNQEEFIRDYNLWDDLSKSNEILIKLAESAKVVDMLRDLKYKAEEAKLITELAGMDVINYALFKQAYSASLDLNKVLNKYEMCKFLNEPYDMEGACIILEFKCGDISSERWAGQLAQMYKKWAEKQGHEGRIVERCPSNNGGLKSVTIELEFKFAYGFLSGESGVHSIIRSSENASRACPEVSVASVDVIPLFIESSPDLLVNDEDMIVSYPSYHEDNVGRTLTTVHIRHLPTGLEVQSAGERSYFANKVKALNRLKAKLLLVLWDQGISNVENIKKGIKMDRWNQIARKYVFRPTKMVFDLKSGVRFRDVNGVLNGNLDPLIAAHISSRQTTSFTRPI